MGIQAIANPPTLPRTAQIWLSSLQYICSKIPWIKLVVSQYSGYLWVIIPKNPAVVFPWTRLSCDALGCQAQPPLRSAHSHLCVQLHWPTRMSHVCVKHLINVWWERLISSRRRSSQVWDPTILTPHSRRSQSLKTKQGSNAREKRNHSRKHSKAL